MRSSPRTASGSSPTTRGTSGERNLRTIDRNLRRELLDRVLIVNERHLRRIFTVYLHLFNSTRPHRTLTHSDRPKPKPTLRK
jgi:hypothetical protein